MDKKNKGIDLVDEALVKCSKTIMKLANKNFKDEKQRYDFIVNCGINLIGNMVMQNIPESENIIDSYEKITYCMLSWFETTFAICGYNETKH